MFMLPDKSSTSLTSWKDPFQVIMRMSPANCAIKVRGNHKIFHRIYAEKYINREYHNVDNVSRKATPAIPMANAISLIDNVVSNGNNFLCCRHKWGL